MVSGLSEAPNWQWECRSERWLSGDARSWAPSIPSSPSFQEELHP